MKDIKEMAKEIVKVLIPILFYFAIAGVACMAIDLAVRSCSEKENTPDVTFAEGDRLDSIIAKDSTLWLQQKVTTDPDALLSEKKTIKATGNSVKSIILAQQTSTKSTITVPLRIDTINHHDTIFVNRTVEFHDRWVDISTADNVLKFEFRDSITTYVTRQYRHRFLWWKWGTKGYNVLLHNANPHSHITYNQTIIPNGSK